MSTVIDAKEQMALAAKVMTGKAFYIRTPNCALFYAHLESWLTTGMLGAVVYGRPRLGKTSAARWTLSILKQRMGAVPWIEVPCRKQDIIGEKAFFQHFLKEVGNRYFKKGTTADLRDRLTSALKTRAARSPIKTVIVFFDEAQNLSEIHYQWLLNVSNELDKDGLRLFCLLVGQHQLVKRKETFIAENLEEIVGRFMTEDWSFPAIDSYDSFEKCLKEFDQVIYPKDSGIRFAANFIPEAVEAGWKLESIAKPFWEAFTKAWRSAGLEGNPAIPMHYFSAAILNLLRSCSAIDRAGLVIGDKVMRESVDRSGIKNAIGALKATFAVARPKKASPEPAPLPTVA